MFKASTLSTATHPYRNHPQRRPMTTIRLASRDRVYSSTFKAENRKILNWKESYYQKPSSQIKKPLTPKSFSSIGNELQLRGLGTRFPANPSRPLTRNARHTLDKPPEQQRSRKSRYTKTNPIHRR